MVIGGSAALFSELEAAVSGGSSARRVEMLRQVTDLFLSDADRLDANQVAVFDDVLGQLIERVEARALAELSARLAAAPTGPVQSIRKLAFHQDASVAVPVLARADCLSDEDLFQVASNRGQKHLLAIAARSTLHEHITDVLIERGDGYVHQSLAKNAGARFSKTGYATLVERAGRDEGLAEKLGVRTDIPDNLLRDLLAKASETVKARLLETAPREMLDKIRSTIDSIVEDIGGKPSKPIDYAEAEAAVQSLNRAGNLNDAAVNRFAVDRNYKNVTVALSVLSSASIEAIEPLLANSRPDGLIVACKAAGLGWPTTNVVIRNRPNFAMPTKVELQQGKEVFDALSLAAAQRTIRFWSARSSVRTSDGVQAPSTGMAARALA
jgi:uncharacterized protein (DUF2336 family)